MLAALWLALLAHAPTSYSKGYYALADRIEDAAVICLGTVTEIVELQDDGLGAERLPFARITVERMLKGDPELREVWHEAWGTWACDTTSARVGERGLFLLGDHGGVARTRPEVRARVLRRLGTERILRNVGSGDGLLEYDPRGFVRMTGDPPGLRVDGRVSPTALEAYTRELLEFAPDRLALFARFGGPSVLPGTFDLRVRADGEVRLAAPLGWKEEVRRFRLEPARLERVCEALQLHVRPEPLPLGRPEESRLRRLVVRLPAGGLEFHEAVRASGSWPPREPALRLAFEEAERAWRTVLELFADESEWIRRKRDEPEPPR